MKLLRPMLLALALSAPLQAEPDTRLPLPNQADQAKAEREVRETFAADYAKAKRAPADREALGRKLLNQGKQRQDDAAVGFVLLRDARDMAAGVGDIKTLTAAADEMSDAFQIARPAALLPALQAAAKAPMPAAAAINLGETCLTTTEELTASDDYEAAAKLMTVAEQAARLARNAALSARVAERSNAIRSLRTAHQRAAGAIEKLRNDPNNPSLNLIAGRFFCFDKDDWEHGVRYLARGSDAELKQLALLDLKGPSTADDQAALGDRYWQAAARAPNTTKTPLQNRARYWYEKALPSMEGLQKARIEERLVTNEVWKLHSLIKPGETRVRPTPEGVETTGEGRIFTTSELRVPVRIDATAKTESTNIRLFFGEKGVVIFNWEAGPQQLRFHAPDSGGISAVDGQGHVMPNTWVRITWIIEPTSSTVLVDGKPRAVFHGDYAGLTGKAGVGGSDAKVAIRQFDVTQISRGK